MATQAITTQHHNVAVIPVENLCLCDMGPLSQDGNVNATALADISPLGLSVNLPGNCTTHYLDYLFKELNLYADLTGNHRKTQQIWFKGDGLITLAPAELTQLAYRVGSQFQLADHDNNEYGIEICHSQITTQHLALLRGLGFKQLRIHFGACHCPVAR